MAVADGYLAYVLEHLSSLGPVRTRKMIGGAGIHINRVFFALIADNVLYLKADEDSRGAFEALGLKPFQPYSGSNEAIPYYPVPTTVVEEPQELRRWARASLDIARRHADAA